MNHGALKSGPLTQAELLLLWSTVAVDSRTYAAPLLAQGEGHGLEVFTQMLAQMARTSQAVDRTTQACYILPHSSQSSEPASGPQNAVVDLTFTRVSAVTPLVLGAGQVWYEEVQTDSGPEGPTNVITGRRYTLQATLVLHPGELGPVIASAIAERPGYGYNNPLAGAINTIETIGAQLNNYGGRLDVNATNIVLTLQINPDVLTPDQIGEYVLFTSGPNQGLYARVLTYRAPMVDVDGGQVILETPISVQSTAFAGVFAANEQVHCLDALSNVVGSGVIVGARLGADNIYRATYTLVSGVAAPVGGALVSQSTSVSMPVHLVSYNPTWTRDPAVSWRVLDFDADLGATVINAASPTGGRTAMLDLLGSERKVYRAPNEPDDSYRQRVAAVADVVSPNAILRGANNILAPYGVGAVLREPGYASLSGFFFDAGSSNDIVQQREHNFAFDMDPSISEADEWKVLLSFQEMRAFFLVGAPVICTGDVGMFFDGSTSDIAPMANAFDIANGRNFFDGYSLDAVRTYQALWNELDERRAGGVSFDLYQLNPDGT